jgi:hypothetical protein
MKAFLRTSGVFAVALLIANLFFAANIQAVIKTLLLTTSGAWKFTGNWSLNGVPDNVCNVVVPSEQSGTKSTLTTIDWQIFSISELLI